MKDGIKINDFIWHPCSMDIIKHKVIAITNFESVHKEEVKKTTQYTLRAVHNVGACGRVEVIISENNGKLRFIELSDEDDIEYASGLQDFIEGNYYTNESEAKLEFYNQQKTITWSSVERNKRLYNESKKNYERVELLVNALKKEIKL